MKKMMTTMMVTVALAFAAFTASAEVLTIETANFAAIEINTNALGLVQSQLKDTSKLTNEQIQKLQQQTVILKKTIKSQKDQAKLIADYKLHGYTFEDAARATWMAYENNKPLVINKWFSRDDDAYNFVTSTGIEAQEDSAKKLALVLELIRQR